MRLLIREAQKYGGNGWSPTTRCTDATGQGREPGGTNWTHLSILRTSCPALIHRSLHAHSAMKRTIPQRIMLWLPPNSRLKEHLAGAFHRADHSLPASPSASPPTVLRPLFHAPRRVAICTSWNRGRCTFLGTCNFRHACTICSDNHQARNYPRKPPDSGNQPAGPTHAPPASGAPPLKVARRVGPHALTNCIC